MFSIPDVAEFFGASCRPTRSFPLKAIDAGQTQNRSDEPDSLTAVVRTDGRTGERLGWPIKAVEVWRAEHLLSPPHPTSSALKRKEWFEVRVQQLCGLRAESTQWGLEALMAQQILKFWLRGFRSDSRIPGQTRSLFSDFEASGTKKPSSLSPSGEGIPPDG